MYLVLGVYVEDITAGKYKRTMVPYKKPNNADRQIVQEELNRVLTGKTTNYCYLLLLILLLLYFLITIDCFIIAFAHQLSRTT